MVVFRLLVFFSFLTKRREFLGYVKYPITVIGVVEIPDNNVFLNIKRYR